MRNAHIIIYNTTNNEQHIKTIMKKILSTMLLALAAAFTFTSCEDVPAPYDTPTNGGGTGGGETELTGDGTEEKPYTVTDIKAGATGTEVFVKAYIVGYVPDKSLDEAIFSADGCKVQSNVIVAASADESTVDNVIAVQLPTGAVRTALNLNDNPSNLKQEVLLCGNIENYFGKAGVKSVVWAKIGSKEAGTKPGTETPAADPKGSGTKEDPYNVAAALNYTKALAADVNSDKEIYIKGKVSTISSEFKADNYGNATYYISDDGTANNQFYAFRSLYLKNTKYTEGNTNIKVGDDVVICGKVVNYKGNTPETVANQSYLYSLNGKTEGENQGGSTGGEEEPSEGAGKVTISDNLLTLTNSIAEESTETITVKPSDLLTGNAIDVTELTLSDGTKIVFDKNGETNGPKYYSGNNYANIRVYKNNKITFKGKKAIAKIAITGDVNGSNKYVGNETAVATVSGNDITYINVFTGTSGGGTQLRINSITITYAK